MPPEKEMLLTEAAQSLGVSASSIYHMGVRGELESRYDERLSKWFVTRASVEKYAKANAIAIK